MIIEDFIMSSCDGRVVKALDLKSNGVSPRRFESCSQRSFFLCAFFIFFYMRPQLPWRDEAGEEQMKLIQDVVRIIRSSKQDYLPPKAKPEGIMLSIRTEIV